MPLLRLEALDEAEQGTSAAAASDADEIPLDLPEQQLASAPSDRAARTLEDLRTMVLGFDGGPRERGNALSEYQRLRAELVSGDPRMLRSGSTSSGCSRTCPS